MFKYICTNVSDFEQKMVTDVINPRNKFGYKSTFDMRRHMPSNVSNLVEQKDKLYSHLL